MNSDLVQRVRLLVINAVAGELSSEQAARAIIPIVLEHAAKVAETRIDCATGERFHAPESALPSGRTSGSVALSPAEIAAAIRAKEVSDE